ncbi:MAG: lysophospholipid acyltransferase family protein [Bacilli bacterium]
MIEASKWRPFMVIFRWIVQWLLRRNFTRIAIRDDRHSAARTSVLFLINHSSWWDGLLLFWLNERVLRTPLFVMMNAEGLRRHPYFRLLGAYSVDNTEGKHLRATLRYTEQKLSSGACIGLFPQGEEQHMLRSPLTFRRGADFIVRRAPVSDVVLIVFYFTFGHQRKPEIFIRIQEAKVGVSYAVQMEELRAALLDDVSREQLSAYRHYRVNGRVTK